RTTASSLPERARCAGVVRPCFCLGILLAALGAAPPRPAETDTELADAEKTLKEANLGTDGPAVLAFLRGRTISEADQKKLASLIPLLGDDEFDVRTKAYKDPRVAGRAALPYLKKAVNDPDPEISASARELVSLIDTGSDTALTVAAARVLAARKPAG